MPTPSKLGELRKRVLELEARLADPGAELRAMSIQFRAREAFIVQLRAAVAAWNEWDAVETMAREKPEDSDRLSARAAELRERARKLGEAVLL